MREPDPPSRTFLFKDAAGVEYHRPHAIYHDARPEQRSVEYTREGAFGRCSRCKNNVQLRGGFGKWEHEDPEHAYAGAKG
jgi:hypothetical protein